MSTPYLHGIEKTLDPRDLQQVGRAAHDIKRLHAGKAGALFFPWTTETQTYLNKGEELRSYKWRPIILYCAAAAAIGGGLIALTAAIAENINPSFGRARSWAWAGFGGFLALTGACLTIAMAVLGEPFRNKGLRVLERRLIQLRNLQDAVRRQEGRDFAGSFTRTMIPEIVETFRHRWEGATPSTEELTQVFSHLLPVQED
jgi:hypothetical protein